MKFRRDESRCERTTSVLSSNLQTGVSFSRIKVRASGSTQRYITIIILYINHLYIFTGSHRISTLLYIYIYRNNDNSISLWDTYLGFIVFKYRHYIIIQRAWNIGIIALDWFGKSKRYIKVNPLREIIAIWRQTKNCDFPCCRKSYTLNVEKSKAF